MSQRIYSLDELHSEKPRGELVFRGTFGKLWSTFCCYGCQSCMSLDPVTDELEVHYPHFYRLDPVE